MGLIGKLVGEVEIRSHGDIFHEIVRHKPHDLPHITPNNIHTTDLHDGEWGNHGSVIVWEYTLGGKKQVFKTVVEALDEGTKSVAYKMVGGDIAELYEAYKLTIHVETKGEKHFVTYTIEYEKKNPDAPEPIAELGFLISVARDIEAHHLK